MASNCTKCGYWTEDKKDPKYKCYIGDCIAKIRDTGKVPKKGDYSGHLEYLKQPW